MAGSANNIRAGGASVEISANTSPLARGLAAAQAKLAAFGGGVKTVGLQIGSYITTGFMAATKGVAIAGAGIGALTAGVLGLAKLFSETDLRLLSPEQAQEALALKSAFAGLSQSASTLNAALMTALGPGIRAIIDIVRLGMQAFQDWIAKHGELLAGINEFLGGVRDALSAGDIGLAVNILWAGVKVAWYAGIAAIAEPWAEWKTSFQQTASEAFLGVLHIANNVWQAMRAAARATGDFLVDTFGSAVDWTAQKLVDLQEATGILSPEEAADVRRTLTEDQDRANRDKQRSRAERDRQIEAEARQREEDFGQTVLDANKSIADANRREIQRAQEDFQNAKDELKSLERQAAAKANPRALPGVVNLEERLSVAGTFSADAARGMASGAPIKDVAKNTKESVAEAKKANEILAEIRDNGGLVFA